MKNERELADHFVCTVRGQRKVSWQQDDYLSKENFATDLTKLLKNYKDTNSLKQAEDSFAVIFKEAVRLADERLYFRKGGFLI